MSAAQYEQAIKPLSTSDKLALARLILNDIAPDVAEPEYGFEYLKRPCPTLNLLLSPMKTWPLSLCLIPNLKDRG